MLNDKDKQEKPIISRPDLNFEDNKVFVFSKYPKKSKEIKWKEVLSTNEEVEKKIIIGRMPDEKTEVGCLETHHFLVYLTLKYIFFEKLFKEKFFKKINKKEKLSFEDLSKEEIEIVKKPIHFSINKILEFLKQSIGGWEYKRIVRWIKELAMIPITFENSFYLASGEEFKTWTRFYILSDLSFYEKNDRKRNKIRGYGYFKFDDHLLENAINFYVHPVRLDVISALRDKRKNRFIERAVFLYIYLDRMLSKQGYFHKNLKDLFEEMDWSQKYVRSPSDRKVKLQPLINLLKDKELSTGIISSIEILKTEDDKDYKLVVKKKPFTKSLKEATTKELKEPQEIIPNQPKLQETKLSNQADLIKYFHKRRSQSIEYQQTDHQPTQKELEQATSLINKYGFKEAKEIIDYALNKAPETNFKMKFFGAVLSYEEEAIKELKRTKELEEEKEQRKNCLKCNGTGFYEVIQENGTIAMAKCKHQSF